MKIAKNDNPQPYMLHTDDEITVGVTHEFQIAGEKSWVKYEVKHRVDVGHVNAEEEAQRLLEHVDAQVMDCVKRVVNTVRNVQ
jgi:hypothetical protein